MTFLRTDQAGGVGKRRGRPLTSIENLDSCLNQRPPQPPLQRAARLSPGKLKRKQRHLGSTEKALKASVSSVWTGPAVPRGDAQALGGCGLCGAASLWVCVDWEQHSAEGQLPP